MNTSLKKLSIAVTRPVQQAQKLCEKIQNLNGKCVLFPTIAIENIKDQSLIRSVIQNLSAFDLAVFVSPNAVQKALLFIREYWPRWPEHTSIAAVGASTAGWLKKFNLPVTICPQERFNSESLLALPALQIMSNKQVVIFKGEGGRDLLTTTLRKRGGSVTEVVVYTRVIPTSSDEFTDDVDVIVCTSNTGLKNLYSMVGEKKRRSLLHKQLLVISDHMVVLAQNLGFVKMPWLADNATDEAIIAALIRFGGDSMYDRAK